MKKVLCKSCNGCDDKKYCSPFRGDTGSYGSGIRLTADGFDCALPVSIDAYNTCSYRCMYCFSNYLLRDPNRKGSFKINVFPPSKLERFLEGQEINGASLALLDEVGGSKTPRCPVQWGALGEPFCRIERQQGVGLEYMDLFEKYRQPTRISTKGGDIILMDEYLSRFRSSPEIYWVAFSIISIDDGVLEKVDKDAPNATVRLKAMEALSRIGVKTSLRFRPIIPGISDSTRRHPKAWRDLVRASADAGAKAISMEFTFVPGAMPPHIKRMWREVERLSGFPIVKFYKQHSIYGSCLRASRSWKEELTFAIYNEAKRLGMDFGISDPHWKELNDFGCCCGISGEDPMFGGWMRKQATEALLQAKNGKLVSAYDGIPSWAHNVKMDQLCVMTGPKNIHRRATLTWADKLKDTWNDLKSARGPLHYFEGALRPESRNPSGDVVYRYAKPKRMRLDSPYIKV